MGFKENLKSELKFQNVLVKELAAKTGISKRTIDNYLREKSSVPPADVAVKIAHALNVSVEYLVLGGSTSESPAAQHAFRLPPEFENLTELQQTVVQDTVIALTRSLLGAKG